MSEILIKNMEMPKEGRIVLAICPDGVVFRYFGDKNRKGGYRIDSAQEYLAKSPAIELTTHGRLGDLDKLQKKVEDCAFVPEQSMTMYMMAVEKEIKKAPTVIEASN